MPLRIQPFTPERLPVGRNHYGPLAMYLAAGFAVERGSDDGSVWVRKAL